MRSSSPLLLATILACSPPPTEPEADEVTFAVTTTGDVEADGEAKASLTLTVKTAEGSPREGLKVTFSVPAPGALTSSEEETDAEGKATTQLSSTAAGALTVTAKVAGDDRSFTADFTFIEPVVVNPDGPTKLAWRYPLSSPLGSSSIKTTEFLRAVGQCVSNTYPCVEIRTAADEVAEAATNAVSVRIEDCDAQFDAASFPTPSGGTIQLSAVEGRAEFHAIKFSTTGINCRLRATALGLADAYSSRFDVVNP